MTIAMNDVTTLAAHNADAAALKERLDGIVVNGHRIVKESSGCWSSINIETGRGKFFKSKKAAILFAEV